MRRLKRYDVPDAGRTHSENRPLQTADNHYSAWSSMTTLLKTHFVAGYYPYGNLSGPVYGVFGKVTVTNLLGQKLALSESNGSTIINGLSVMATSYTVGNGNRVQLIDKLLPVK